MPPREEVAAHPVGRVALDEGVGRRAVHEDVHEEAPARREPAGDARRRAPASCACARTSRPRRRGRSAHRCRNAFMSQVMTSTLSRPRRTASAIDEVALRARVRHRGDPARRDSARHPQRERAPAAAELEDALPFARPARSQVAASAAASATSRLSTPGRTSSRCTCGAVPAPRRRTPPAPRSAARWPSRGATRRASGSCRRRRPRAARPRSRRRRRGFRRDAAGGGGGCRREPCRRGRVPARSS